MKFIAKRPKTYQWMAISAFFGSGAGSVYLFYQVPGLWFLQGIDEESLRTVVSLAWVLIFPTWFALYFVVMALLGSLLSLLEP